MKKLVLCAVFFILHSSFAQQGQWTWLRGPQLQNTPGTFGTQGVPGPTNDPPALYEPSQWTDNNGDFWLFGGNDNNGNMYADMWRYNLASNEWTWMKGPSTGGFAGIFGTQGVSAPANNPPCGIAFSTWTDVTGGLWLFGGNGWYNTLWRFDITSNEWTWIKGSNIANDPGSYGTIGVPALTNNPSARNETSTTWVDSNNDLWVFGGYQGSTFSDLWRYHIATNEWTWMKGPNTPNQPGVYGTLGIESAANNPGSRLPYASWTDCGGNLWMSGGYNINGGGQFNDVWRYNPLTGNWTWVGGSDLPNQPGIYNMRCTPDVTNIPSARWENRATWTDVSGNFWFFGGEKYTGGELNDLWMYCVNTEKWTWVSGDTINDPPGIWGSLGVSSAANVPSGRRGSVSWRDAAGNFYLWGGVAFTPVFGRYSDMWRYVPDSTCPQCFQGLANENFMASDTAICPGTCINLNNLSQAYSTYQWLFSGATPGTSTDEDPQSICYFNTGNYDITLIAARCGGSIHDTLTFSNYITVFSEPVAPNIVQGGDTLYASGGYTSYQWYFGSDTIVGATNSFYVATQSGNYNVVVTDENGCAVGAGIVNVVAGIAHSSSGESWGEVFPNPARNELKVSGFKFKVCVIEIYNSIGEKVYAVTLSEVEANSKEKEIVLNTSSFSSGIYLVRVSGEEKIMAQKIIIGK